MYSCEEVIMKLNQEELFILSQIYEEGMDKKSVIKELNSIDEEGNFLKNLMGKIGNLSEEELKIALEEGIKSLSFSLEDIEK